MDNNPQFIREAQFVLWFQWVFLNIFGWAFGLFATWGTQTETITRFGWIAVFLGIGQWMVLRKYLPKPTWLWIGLTALGMMAAQFLSQLLVRELAQRGIVQLQGIGLGGGLVMGGLIGAVIGLCLALAHFPMITRLVARHTASARDWFVVNMVGWGLGFQSGTILGFLLPSADERLTSLIATLLSAIISGLWVTQLVKSQ